MLQPVIGAIMFVVVTQRQQGGPPIASASSAPEQPISAHLPICPPAGLLACWPLLSQTQTFCAGRCACSASDTLHTRTHARAAHGLALIQPGLYQTKEQDTASMGLEAREARRGGGVAKEGQAK